MNSARSYSRRFDLEGQTVFLSASIPNVVRRPELDWDDRGIANAVVALARAVLSSNGVLVTATHPTIAPLLLYVANDLGVDAESPQGLRIYQSEYFRDRFPEAILSLNPEAVRKVPAQPQLGLPPDLDLSLQYMRETMFRETNPTAAVFVGGMEGIFDEHQMLAMRGIRRLLPLSSPGGAAAELSVGDDIPEMLRTTLRSDVYPVVADAIVEFLSS